MPHRRFMVLALAVLLLAAMPSLAATVNVAVGRFGYHCDAHGAPGFGMFGTVSPTNIEMLIKVLNACVAPFNRYGVYFAATTNVELGVVVTDTQTGKTVAYFNPLNRAAAPVQDNNAFATCP